METLIPSGAEWLLDEYDAERFWAHVNRRGGRPYLDDPLARIGADAEECWIWNDGNLVGGYATFKVQGVQHPAHRIAYREFGNKIPDALQIDHLCRTTMCMNPTHMEPVTHVENIARGVNGHKTHCPSGHEYSPENTRYDKKKARLCRACLKSQRREQYLARKRP